jgi:hypothetical protein
VSLHIPAVAEQLRAEGTEKGQSTVQREPWWRRLWKYLRKIGGAARI